MSTDAEKLSKQRSYERSINTKNSQIRSEQQKIEQLEEEIDRLQKAYSRLDTLEGGDANDLKKKTKVKNATTGYDWRGKNKNDFDDLFDSNIYPDAKEFKDYIDGLKDQINWAIHERQVKINDSDGIIGSLKSGISWLKTCIWNLWN